MATSSSRPTRPASDDPAQRCDLMFPEEIRVTFDAGSGPNHDGSARKGKMLVMLGPSISQERARMAYAFARTFLALINPGPCRICNCAFWPDCEYRGFFCGHCRNPASGEHVKGMPSGAYVRLCMVCGLVHRCNAEMSEHDKHCCVAEGCCMVE